MMTTKNHIFTATPFLQLPAVKKLRELAIAPVDLTKKGGVTPERLETFFVTSCGLRLVFGTERVDKLSLTALKELADESFALEKMMKMQEGEIVNFIQGFESEERPALHTATRDFFGAQERTAIAKSAADEAFAETEKLKKLIEKIDSEKKFTDLIVVGIGGSELGPKAILLAMENLIKEKRQVHFVSSVDPDEMAETLKTLSLKNTLVLTISKSGSTQETLANQTWLLDLFAKSGLASNEHFLVVTQKNSLLDRPEKYLEVFYIWDWIGGRYSVSSMVGGVLLSFALGFETYFEFLRGAHDMDKAALNKDLQKNIPLMEALLGIWNRNFLHYPSVAIIPYCFGLRRFAAHLQQLDMESHGKCVDQRGSLVGFSTGPLIFGEVGTNAQHSFYQLLHQGTDIIPVEMIGFLEPREDSEFSSDASSQQQKLLANLFAQSLALAIGKKSDNPNKNFAGNRPTRLLLAKKLDPYTLGSLLSTFENKIAFQGFIWGINSFDQEGVQLGKVLAKKMLGCIAKTSSEPFALGDAYLTHLQTLKESK